MWTKNSLSTFAICRLRCDIKLLSTQTNEWHSGKPFSEIPGPSPIRLIKEVTMPGGRYHKVTLNDMGNRLREDYGSIVKIPAMFGTSKMLMLFSPDDIENVHRTESKWPYRRQLDTIYYFRHHHRPDLYKSGGGLLAEQGEKWYAFRSKVNSVMMKPSITKLYIPKIDDVAHEFVVKIREIRGSDNEMPDNFIDNINDWALESISLIALDTRLGVMGDFKSHRLNQSIKKVAAICYEYDIKPGIWRIYKTPGFMKAMKVYEESADIIHDYVMQAVERFEQNEQTRDGEGVLKKLVKIDKNTAIIMAQDMLLGGVDTTSVTLAILLYSLAKHPLKQEILRKEIFTLLPEKDSKLNPKMLNNIPYLRGCMKEAMRLYPPAAGNARKTERDLVMQGYQVPKDTEVVLMTNIISTDESNFKRSKEFIPERWLKYQTDRECPNAKDTNQFAFLPFGFGSRMCIGRRFAELEIEVLIARILREFKVEWHQPDLKFKSTIINVPANPLKFKFIDL